MFLCGRRHKLRWVQTTLVVTDCCALSFVKDQMPRKERQNIRGHASVRAPSPFSAHAIVLFRFVSDPELVEFVCKGLIGINMIVIRIAAGPIKLEPSQRFEVFGILWNQRFPERSCHAGVR